MCVCWSCCYSDPNVRITNMQDFNFGVVTPPFVALQMNKMICVFLEEDDDNKIEVIATGMHDFGDDFHLENGGSSILYQVGMTNPGNNNFKSLGKERTRKAQTKNESCVGSENLLSTLRITIPAASFTTALVPGTYQDTLSIMIKPR